MVNLNTDGGAGRPCGDESASGHILVVEDDRACQLLMQKVLQAMGLTSCVVSNGKLALSLLEQCCKEGESFDLIIMDCEMPVMGGIEATRRIREAEASNFQNTPIIAVTSATGEENRQNCFSAGMNAFVHKPVSVETLFPVINEFICIAKE